MNYFFQLPFVISVKQKYTKRAINARIEKQTIKVMAKYKKYIKTNKQQSTKHNVEKTKD